MLALLALLALVVAACTGDDEPEVLTEGDRVTISLAVLDKPGHRTALYAIEQQIVASDTVDVVLRYLPRSEIDEAVRSKQFDVIEVAAPTVPLDAADDFDLVVLSSGLQDLDGTLLFVSADSTLATPRGLAGKTYGVVSRGDASTLVTRFLLQRSYGIDASLQADEVTIEEAPPESLPTLVENDEVEAAVVTEFGAFQLLGDDDFRVLSHVAVEVQELTDGPIMSTLLVTYPDIAGRKADALKELSRLLAESVAYFKANQDSVIETVAADQRVDPAFLSWWWERYDLPLGDLSEGTQTQILSVWEAARVLGDIEGYPELVDVLFNPAAPTPTPEPVPPSS